MLNYILANVIKVSDADTILKRLKHEKQRMGTHIWKTKIQCAFAAMESYINICGSH